MAVLSLLENDPFCNDMFTRLVMKDAKVSRFCSCMVVEMGSSSRFT